MVRETEISKDGVALERRRFPRLNASVDIEYSILKRKTNKGRKTQTKDISTGGICLIVYERINIGSVLALKIHLSDINYVINAKGRVVWSSYFTVASDGRDRYDLGIEFTQIGKADREKINNYVFKLK